MDEYYYSYSNPWVQSQWQRHDQCKNRDMKCREERCECCEERCDERCEERCEECCERDCDRRWEWSWGFCCSSSWWWWQEPCCCW